MPPGMCSCGWHCHWPMNTWSSWQAGAGRGGSSERTLTAVEPGIVHGRSHDAPAAGLRSCEWRSRSTWLTFASTWARICSCCRAHLPSSLTMADASSWAAVPTQAGGPCQRERCQLLTVWFRCKAIGGHAVVNDEESTAVGWYSPEELPDLDGFDQLRIDTALDDDAPTWFAAPGRTYDWLPARS